MAKDLSEYRGKRDFKKTPEPGGGRTARARRRKAGPGFVVHRHEATRPHYDLRLEIGGVLESWAVPRGFSYVPAEKRLAVRTEDHPLEYLSFEGVIPAGEYGAGTMEIWDRGGLEVVGGDGGKRAAREGKLEVRLSGRRLRGEWHLVKTTRGDRDWLLFKARDRYARSAEDPPYPFAVDLARARQGPLPRRLTPARAGESASPFSGPEWFFEVEFDGARVLAVKDGDAVRFRGSSAARKLERAAGSVLASLAGLRAENAIVDGVIVVLDEHERPSRARLDEVLAGRAAGEPIFYAFDLVHFDEWRLGDVPLADRKALLRALLPAGPSVLYVDHVVGEGERLCGVVADAGLAGVIAKEAASPYRGGASTRWRRIAVDASDAAAAGTPLRDVLAPARRARARFGRVRFTNRDKVYWPERGFTKGDLLDYYERVAEAILPYLHERPLHLYRFPDGIHGESFYQHNAPAHTPGWVRTEDVPHGDGERTRSVICGDRETLLYLANLGSIDFHPWLSRLGSLETPDWLVLDLDPDGSPVGLVVRVARAIGKLLRGLGLRPYVKTSGASGLHITIPLIPGYTYDQARLFGEAIARKVANDHGDAATVERAVGRRRGRVYIDFMQNRRGQTVVPPWVVRPVPAASVSTPLEWDELAADLDLAGFDIVTVPDRLSRIGDLFRATLDDRQDLLPAIEAFREQFG